MTSRTHAAGPEPAASRATIDAQTVARSDGREAGGRARTLKCRGGPLDRARLPVPQGATEVTAPVPGPSTGAPLVAVYRVERRRRARGAAFDVLVHVRNVIEERAAGPPQ
jgi:hypothetical protein